MAGILLIILLSARCFGRAAVLNDDRVTRQELEVDSEGRISKTNAAGFMDVDSNDDYYANVEAAYDYAELGAEEGPDDAYDYGYDYAELGAEHKSATASTTAAQAGGAFTCSGPLSSYWHINKNHPSCSGNYITEGVNSCPGDETSISVDLTKVKANKAGVCWVFKSTKTFHVKKGWNITFTAEWKGCEGHWLAPLWFTPDPWVNPQGTSGEIDLIESGKCIAGAKQFQTSVGSPCKDCRNTPYAPTASSNGPMQFTCTINEKGDLIMDAGEKKNVSYYPNYMTVTHGAKHNSPYNLMTDIFNSNKGDAHGAGCRIVNANSKCQYKISNIKLA